MITCGGRIASLAFRLVSEVASGLFNHVNICARVAVAAQT